MFGRIGPTELLLLLGLALIIFGPKKLPEIGKSLGKSINEFKRSINSDEPDEKPVSGQNQEVLSTPESENENNERNE